MEINYIRKCKFLLAFIYFSVFSLNVFCEGKWWNSEYNYRIKLTLKEQSGIDRIEEPIIIKGKQFLKSIEGTKIKLGDIKTSSIRVVSCNDTDDFKEIPVQVDEKDDKGFISSTPNGILDLEDAVIFLLSVDKNSSKTVWIYFHTEEKPEKNYSSDLQINNPSEFCLNDNFNETAKNSADFWANNSFYGIGVNIKGPKELIFSKLKNTILLNGVITKYGIKGHKQLVSDQPGRGISLMKFGDINLYSIKDGWNGFTNKGPVRATVSVFNDNISYNGFKYLIVRNFHIYSYSKILEIEDVFVRKEDPSYRIYENIKLQEPIITYSNIIRLVKGPMYWFDEIKGGLYSGYQTGWKTGPKEVFAPWFAILDEGENLLTENIKSGFGIILDYNRLVETMKFGCHALPGGTGDQPYGGFCTEYKYRLNFGEKNNVDTTRQWVFALIPGDTVEKFINIAEAFQNRLEQNLVIGKLEISKKEGI